MRASGKLAAAAILLGSAVARAGPPYATDDPEPVEYQHWELYLGSQSSHDADGWSGTAPHLEVNYGVPPTMQLHLVAPLSYIRPAAGQAQYGYGDTEVGIKCRFIPEGTWMPQVGVFPLLEIPTGSQSRGLGSGMAQLYLPLWLQKRWDAWTSYGGFGYWFNPGEHNRNWWFFGWQLQRQISDGLALGAEIFHTTPKDDQGGAETRFNIGAVVDLSDLHHLLLSVGRGFQGPNMFQSYLAYQLTWGPGE